MSMDAAQRATYEGMLNTTRAQIDQYDRQIEEELAKVRERLTELEQGKKAARQIYDGICTLLGIPNDLEEEGEGEEDLVA